ncbi:hypothetical protein JVX96_24480 [Variovorax sp. PDNC026]|uniref:hypothetical protein n=1 Tax=Variovorax sp. PDNC026 TaxID=2811425 RepID=UPI0019640365|nr:hypothetical protein [Variovorax sp. PDNC026]QRY31201.1 hypothetical protein JVX96_24480 [Variovorax sp. PDNC026]
MHVKPLSSLSHEEVADLAAQAAERGEELALANPFPEGSWRHIVFRDVFAACVADLQPIG